MNTCGESKPIIKYLKRRIGHIICIFCLKKEYCRMVKETHGIFRNTRHSWSFHRKHDLCISFVKASEHRFHSPADAPLGRVVPLQRRNYVLFLYPTVMPLFTHWKPGVNIHQVCLKNPIILKSLGATKH